MATAPSRDNREGGPASPQEFLRRNFPICGSRYCAVHLTRLFPDAWDEERVLREACRLGLNHFIGSRQPITSRDDELVIAAMHKLVELTGLSAARIIARMRKLNETRLLEVPEKR